jgi:hypothetical protein
MSGLAVVADVVLSADERQHLARCATRLYEAQRYGETRVADPALRAQVRTRWQAIADAFDPEPYGPDVRAAELAQRAREAAEETP